MQMPVVTSVSHATRPFGSSVSTASRTASETWSAILSGWPSVTDSDVKMYFNGKTPCYTLRSRARALAFRAQAVHSRGSPGRRVQLPSLSGGSAGLAPPFDFDHVLLRGGTVSGQQHLCAQSKPGDGAGAARCSIEHEDEIVARYTVRIHRPRGGNVEPRRRAGLFQDVIADSMIAARILERYVFVLPADQNDSWFANRIFHHVLEVFLLVLRLDLQRAKHRRER